MDAQRLTSDKPVLQLTPFSSNHQPIWTQEFIFWLYQCTMYNRSCRLLVKLNTLKGGLECSKKNILKVSLFEHSKERFFHIFLRTSGHCFEWTFHPVNTISLLVDGRFSRKCYNKPLCVFDICISYWWKQSIFTLFTFISHFHCFTQGVSPFTTDVHPSPLASLTQGSPS